MNSEPRKNQNKPRRELFISVLALVVAWLIKQANGTPLLELHYLISLPWQSPDQLEIEDRLTNARILELEQTINELEQQNQQFNLLLKSANLDSEDLAAPIIGRSMDGWWNQITLGKGSSEGVETGHVVLGIGGIVGRVVSVTPHTSRVLLVSDPNSRVGVVVSRSRNLGYLKGTSRQTAVMQFFTKVVDVEAGDTIATSPIGNIYPQGLTVGKVISVDRISKAAPEATIQLSAPFDLLEWVIIRPFTPKIS